MTITPTAPDLYSLAFGTEGHLAPLDAQGNVAHPELLPVGLDTYRALGWEVELYSFTVDCAYCGMEHTAEATGQRSHGWPMFEVICTETTPYQITAHNQRRLTAPTA